MTLSLDTYSDDSRASGGGVVDIGGRWSRVCQCGNPKGRVAKACRRCTYLDGKTPTANAVIAALRGSDGMSLMELCAAVYGNATRANCRGMLALMQRMMRIGRIRRYEDYTETSDYDCFGQTAKSTRLQWVYCLDGRTEDGK